jgi:CRP-like cAMP-binding protein
MAGHPFQNFMVRYRAGETIFREGEAATTMFIVQSGRIGLFREVKERRQGLGFMEKGDFFGEMSILEGLPRTNSAEAVEDAELIEINSMIFDRMIRGNIEIAIRMLRKLSIRLREAERRLAETPVAGSRPSPAAGPDLRAKKQPAKTRAGGPRLVIEDGSAEFPVGDGETIIGRYDPVTELKPDIDLADLDLKRSVSRRHARIVQSAGGLAVVVEVGALSGTRLNDQPIAAGEPHALSPGDRLTVGNIALVLRT